MKNSILQFIIFIITINMSVAQQGRLIPAVARPVYFDVSPPLKDMLITPLEQYDGSWKDGVINNYVKPAGEADWKPGSRFIADPGLQDYFGSLPSDTTIRNFDGMGNGSGYVPPDTHGDVGFNHYYQVVNCSYAIYNKSGVKIFGPVGNSSVWSGMPNNSNDGDAIVLFDELANRWIFSQFSLPNGSSTAPFYMMIAVSQTPDPMGSWYRWEYEFSAMPDYPKFGIWPDGYYMSTNNFSGGWVGNGAYAFDRLAMLAGDPDAVRISFTLPPGGDGFISLLPADCDGAFPAPGTPNYFAFIRTDSPQRLGVYEFHADFATPANSTFGNLTYLNVNPFNTLGWGSGIPQKGSPQLLETLGDRLMYRLQYRKFNGYASMVLNHTVNAGMGNAGIRWYELRSSGTPWSIYQQATYAPDNNSRWMGSIAQDTAGTIAIGYSVSGPDLYPGIRYTGRLKSDPLNQMTIMEKAIVHGGGSQTGVWSGRSRWGDYSALSIDPSNPTTFWYTQEYYVTTSSSSWQTRIASFTFGNVFSSAASASPARMCSASADSAQLNAYGYGGSGTYTYSWTSIPAGFTSTLKSPKVKPQQTTRYVVATSDGSLTRHDTAEVNIVSAPVVYTGSDTIACWYVSPVPLYATAVNYSKIAWGTAGDGYFSNPSSLITSYFPGIKDKTTGYADLKLLVIPLSPCLGNSITSKRLLLDPCTGVGEPGVTPVRLSVQPNPAHGMVAVSISGITSMATLKILATDGKTVYSATVDPAGSMELTRQIDLTGFPAGLYLLQLDWNGQKTTSRFIVQ